MKMLGCLFVGLCWIAITPKTAVAASTVSIELWVSPAGNDSGTGGKQSPFATLERARDVLRSLKPPHGATVWVEPGIYSRTQTFTLGSQDSGNETAPIVYRAEKGVVRLHAGRFLKSGDFEKVSDSATLNRLDSTARNQIFCLNLASANIKHAGPYPAVFNSGGGLVELFCNDVRMPLSRWPNEGNTTMESVLDKGDLTRGPQSRGGKFVAREERVAHWHPEHGIWLEGYWRVPWDPETVRVKSIDPGSREVLLAEGIAGGIGSKYAKNGELGDGKEPWCAVNVLEEIDKPGEWCVDFDSKVLYFWPPVKLENAKVYVSDFDKPVISLFDVTNVVFQGFIVEGGLGNGIEISGGSNNLVAGCTFRNLGGTGVVIQKGTKNGVRSSDFYALGQSGICLSGGDRKSLTGCGNFADNNHLHHLGVLKKCYAAGINLGAFGTGEAVGCIASHNSIHDMPHAGVLYGGNDNVLEFNDIARVVLTSADMGAFYTCHDWTSRGNVVRHNFVFDSPRANAFYMDDGDSGDEIVGNIAVGCFYGPFIGGGHDNIVRNNIIVSTERGIHLDARGIARGYDKDKGLLDRLKIIDYKNPPWSTRYPTMTSILDTNPAYPRGNIVERNAIVQCNVPFHTSSKKEELQFSVVRDNIEISEKLAGFENPRLLKYRLRPDSPIFTKIPGFEPVPFEKIGLYVDEYRTTIPERKVGASGSTSGVFDSETDVQRSNRRKSQ